MSDAIAPEMRRATGTLYEPHPPDADPANIAEPVAEGSAAELRGLFGRDSIYVGLWMLPLGMAALFTPVNTRVLGPSRFGLVASSIAVMQVLFALGSASLQTAVQRRYAAPGGERDAQRLVTLAIAIAVSMFVLADLTGPAWARALKLGPYPPAVRYAVAAASLGAINAAALGLLRSRDQLGPFAVISLLQSVVAEGLGLLLVVAVHRSAADWLLGMMLANAAALCVGLAYGRPLMLSWQDRRIVSSALRYSTPLVPAALAIFVLQASDRLVVQHDLGSAAVARYSVAYNIGAIPLILLNTLNTIWLPRFFALADARLRASVLAQSRDALYVLLIPVVVGLGMGAPILLYVWAPASYQPDRLLLVVSIVAATSATFAGAICHMRVLTVEGRTLAVALATTLAGAVNLALNVALVPALGIEGSALATLLGYAALHAALAITARKVIRLRTVQRGVIVGILAGVAVAIVAAWLPVSLPFLLIRLAIGSGCLAVLVGMLLALSGKCHTCRIHRVAAWMMSGVVPALA